MKLTHITITFFSLALILSSCGDGSDDPETPDPVAAPQATTLVFPENNTECNEGVIINDNTSRVTFRWNVSENTDSYEVTVTNLNSNTSTNVNSTTEQSDITIDRGTPYEWFVTSMANGTSVTAISPTFRFYNQGPGIENYAPFPADAVNPRRGSTITNTTAVTLEWIGSDIDNDIIEYEVFLDTNSTPTTSIGVISNQQLETNISSNTTYYWRVVSIDSGGNTSQSEIFQFKNE